MTKQELLKLLKTKGLIIRIWVRFDSDVNNDIAGANFTITKSEFKKRLVDIGENFLFNARYYEESNTVYIN